MIYCIYLCLFNLEDIKELISDGFSLFVVTESTLSKASTFFVDFFSKTPSSSSSCIIVMSVIRRDFLSKDKFIFIPTPADDLVFINCN
ncbi:MAG: hypothetical protein [Caudoviricetes sp.]|nr:MAG: hypothetical protein [Caudoviricetes sp.]